MEERFKEAFPDLIIQRSDDGNTIGVKLPEMEDGYYLRRVFNPDRDGVIGYWEVSDARAAETMAQMIKFRLAYQETLEKSIASIDTTTHSDGEGAG